MALDLTKPQSTNSYLKELYKKIFGLGNESPAKFTPAGANGVDKSGVCGGTILVTPSANAFPQPSFIECTGADGTITGVDEYGNVVTTYPMTVGKITPSRWNKVTAVSAGVVVWRHYSL